MAATYTEKRLASGQVASSLTTVYTVPASTTALLTQLWLYNTNTTAEEVTFAVNDGSDRILATLILEAGEYGIVELKGMALNTGDLVKLGTDTASQVNYILSGVEKA